MVEYATKEKKTEKKTENLTGIPTQMKARMEQSTGLSFDDVRVHYNSAKPAKLGALAYTQGKRVEIGPGQERHLPHELGHVVQQKMGLVRANVIHPQGVAMNTEEELERQADEIGAGRRIELSPVNNASTDIVQRYISVGNCIFAQAANPKGKRRVMVKDGEPASVYFEESVLNTIKPLDQLGIVKTEEVKTYTDSRGLKIGRFVRYGQGQIPDVSELKPSYGYEHIKMEGKQSSRPDEKYQRAIDLMNKQIQMIDPLLGLAKSLLSNIKSGDKTQLTILADELFNGTDAFITRYRERLDTDEYIAISSLGHDTILDIITLSNIASRVKNNALNALENDALVNLDSSPAQEIVIALEIATEDLTYRWKQIKEETKIAKFIPQLPTGCDHSSLYRDKLTNAYRRKFLENMKKLSNSEGEDKRRKRASTRFYWLPTYTDRIRADLSDVKNNGFEQVMSWPYHYATSIRLPRTVIGPDDRLFIEDAVGKSAAGYELANAHWVAHIYGRREDGTVNRPESPDQDRYEKLDCKFNKLTDRLRSQFFELNKIPKDRTYKMQYWVAEKHILGELEFVVRDNMFKYKFNSTPKLGSTKLKLEPHMQHFLMDLAKTITDEFVLLAANEENMKDMNFVDEYLGRMKYEQDQRRFQKPLSPFAAIENLVADPPMEQVQANLSEEQVQSSIWESLHKFISNMISCFTCGTIDEDGEL